MDPTVKRIYVWMLDTSRGIHVDVYKRIAKRYLWSLIKNERV